MIDAPPAGIERITGALRARRESPALCAFLTAGYPSRMEFAATLPRIAKEADLVEIGVPFSDPMADGLTIQRASRQALDGGTTLAWILALLRGLSPKPAAPLLLMSYLNPLLAFGPDRLVSTAASSGVSGFVVPDLPLEESAALRAALDAARLALVQIVTPASPPGRRRAICGESRGFVYAVTVAGTTGVAEIPPGTVEYLREVKACSSLPVLAGFGIRKPHQARAISAEVDGVIVGSALIEEMERGRDPVSWLRSLRKAMSREAAP